MIAGDLKTYANPVRRAFARYEIPVFVDETRKILLNPALEFIKASLETARQNYSRESVMRFIRTGILNLTAKEMDLTENYLRAAGIRGKSKWGKAMGENYQTDPGRRAGRV